MNWIENAISDYYKWLRNRTGYSTDEGTGWAVIHTPFIGLFNDSIDIYLRKEGDSILLSDDGETFASLSDIGINVSRSAKRREWLDSILLTYGIANHDGELVTKTTEADFPQAKHNLVSAILSICDLEVTGTKSIVSMFHDDVRRYFDEISLTYTPGFITRGSSGLESTFDFQIAGKTQETVIKTFGSLNMANLPTFLFGWDDIKATREAVTGKTLHAVAIVDDSEKASKGEYVAALERKNAHYFSWGKRTEEDSINYLHQLMR